MDIQTISDVQKQFFQSVIAKLVARKACTQSELESMQKLMDNVRDSKHFHLIMEKLRECGQFELDNFDENFKEGFLTFFNYLFYCFIAVGRRSNQFLKIIEIFFYSLSHHTNRKWI